MPNPSNATSSATLKTAHAAAETGGVTFNAAIGGSTVWSRAAARVAYGSGSINQTRFDLIMTALQNYESTQYEAARDTEGSTGVLPQ